MTKPASPPPSIGIIIIITDLDSDGALDGWHDRLSITKLPGIFNTFNLEGKCFSPISWCDLTSPKRANVEPCVVQESLYSCVVFVSVWGFANFAIFLFYYCIEITRVRSCFVYAGGSPVLVIFCVMRGLRNFAESSDIGCEGVASFSVCEDRIQDTIVMEI